MPLTKRDLFGGSITAFAPSNLIDASVLRQIPDTQEVLLYPDSSVSIVIEILEKVEPSDISDAIKFHFDSLAHDDSALSATVEDVVVFAPNRDNSSSELSAILFGYQRVRKYNQPAPDDIRVLMALYRLEQKPIDVVVTFNIPVKSSDGGAVSDEGLITIRNHFSEFTGSLQIVNYELFA